MTDIIPFFTESLELREHPIKKSKEKIRLEYCQALSYIVNSALERAVYDVVRQDAPATDTHQGTAASSGKLTQVEILQKYINQRLKIYCEQLDINTEKCVYHTDTQKKELLHSLSACITPPWRYKLKYWLLCDAALILLDHTLIEKAIEIEKGNLSQKASTALDKLIHSFCDSNSITEKLFFADYLANQYRKNKRFSQAKAQKLIVTANVSAGKSTLINALTGKPLARTSQETCTGNICYLYNKAFEDNRIALASPELNLDADPQKLRSYLWKGEISIAAHFTGISNINFPLCIMDTPGVNAALYKEHSKIAHNALKHQNYDKLLYIISPANLGTDAEIKHLKWVAENANQKKMIFVLNKLDDFRGDLDDISESMIGLRNDLLKLGFESPVICPISAYFGFLLKMKLTNQVLSEDEIDEYTMLAKKFSRPKYDLSGYYEGSQVSADDTEELKLCKQSGLYGLEKTIYGGAT